MSLPPRRVKSMYQSSARTGLAALSAARAAVLVVGAIVGLCGGACAARAAEAPAANDPPACKAVRISDIGWTDVTATTALFSALLQQIGYDAQVTVLSVPVTYASMKNKDIDVFLGNWMPTMEGDRKAYYEDRSIEVVGANLTGAKYTLGV